LLVSGPVAQEKQAIWMISIIGTSLKKLRDGAHDASLSPDGSQIAFTTEDRDSIWVMNADGSQAHEAVKIPDFRLFSPFWLGTGKRIGYVKFRNDNGKITSLVESRTVQGEDPVVLVDNPDIADGTTNQPGRFVYTVNEAAPHERDSNLWDLWYDPESGRPKGVPRRLTDWTGFAFLSPSITADGKHFIFLNQKDQTAVFVGELAAGGDELKSPQRVTLNANFNWPTAWSPDSRSVLFYSNRNGAFDIYKQGVEDRTAESVASGQEEKWAPQVSADGKWILYMQWPKASPDNPVKTGKLMRVAMGGGAPEPVMDFTGKRIGSAAYPINTVGGLPSFRCPKRADANCVIAERKDKNVVFTSFDPIQGRKAEIGTVPMNSQGVSWDLSPDGTRVLFAPFSYTEGKIEVIPVNGGARQSFAVAPWMEISGLAWAADGKSLFFTSFSSRGTTILHSDLAGHSKTLFKPSWDIFAVAPSPDGKYLAFGPVISDANAWTTSTFPSK
jgi:Tol biopolymer transport system component